jgi:hypothetical protein
MMANGFDGQLESIDRATLTPLVRCALDSETVDIVGWECEQIYAGATRADVYHLSGDARDPDEIVPGSLILKVVRPEPGSDDPSGSLYWKREVLANQAGLLGDLPGGLAAPRCFAIGEHPGEEFWIGMEEVRDEMGRSWPLEQYGVAARHLGQFNGAYLMGRLLPNEPWLSRGWLRSRLVRAAPGVAQLRDSLEHPLVRRTYPPDVADGLFRLWAERETYLDALDRLPQAFCHLDAQRRNLFPRTSAHAGHETVAIDWEFAGIGAVGEEIAPLVVVSAALMEDGMAKLPELDAIVFDGYLEGLRDAGWYGDGGLVRFGYAADTALRCGLAFTDQNVSLLVDESQHARWEQVFGRPVEHAVELWMEGFRFLLGLAEEARGLLDEL